jgi:hypothetical protein
MGSAPAATLSAVYRPRPAGDRPHARNRSSVLPSSLARAALFATSSRVAAAARPLTCAVLLACGVLSAGCGTPPELSDPRRTAAPAASAAAPIAAVTSTPPPSPVRPPATSPSSSAAATTYAEATAVACRGTPSGAQVIALLRGSAGLLAAGTKATVLRGPLCAGTWQYTVLQVSGREPLQVVTSGLPPRLTLVTAGTDVCNIQVRTAGPIGIRTAACEALPTGSGA